ncbi:MAG: hypothetical protein ACRDP6_07680, partial [Actinoallomurus sp.]
DATASERLTSRELGSELEEGLKASAAKARLLEARVPADTVRVMTDRRPILDVAREVVAATGWVGEPTPVRLPVADHMGEHTVE